MPTSDTKMRVVISEDHALLRLGLKILLEQRNVDIVAEAENGQAAVKAVADLHPDVVLMDLSMPVMDGIEAAKKIREFDHDVRIIMLTSNDNDEHIFASFAAGANGYCLKETSPERLMHALETVRDGDLWIDSNIASKVLRNVSTTRTTGDTANIAQPGDPSALSKEELDVLHSIVEGLGLSEIALKVGKSEQQVKCIEYSIMERLAASDRTQSALRALRAGTEPRATKVVMSCPDCAREFAEGFHSCPFDGVTLDAVLTDEMTGKIFADRYEILARLGSGGMSVVYKARHRLLGRLVAIKMLDPLLCSDLQNARRFREEALASSLLNHPNLISIFDFGLTASGEPYLIMDYLSGRSLSDVISMAGPLHVDDAVPIFLQACEGLSHAHSKGIVHRDLKPSNIMLVTGEHGSGSVKVIDFGIARVWTSARLRGQGLTQPGELIGSPTYMSPEQCTGQVCDDRSDIYSMGITMYEALTGELPFLGRVAAETMQMHIDVEPIPVSTRFPSIPQQLDRIIMKCMRKQPEHRYVSMDELKMDLYQLMSNQSDQVPQEAVPR